jgi:hypothetical protein
MKLSDAIMIFDTHVENGQVPDRRRPGQAHRISPGRRDVIIAHVRNAVARAMDVDRGDVTAIDSVEIDPLWATLPDHAYQSAQENGRSAPRNERTNVMLFRATVEGREYDTTPKHGHADRRPVEASLFFEPWRPLYDALLTDCTNPDGTKNSRKSFPAQLLGLQNLLATHGGIRSPYEIPDDYHIFVRWTEAAGVKAKKRHAMLAALRRAREILVDERIPTLYMGAHATERGLGSLPNLSALLAERGCLRDSRHMLQEELIAILAPTMHAALERYLAMGRSRNRRPGWFESQIGMTSRIAASAIRLGYDATSLTYVDLWTCTTKVARFNNDSETDPVLAAVMGADYIHEEEYSLIRCITDEMSRQSYNNSPIEVVSAAPLPSDHVTMYTQRVIQDVKSCFWLVKEIFGDVLQKHKRTTWEATGLEYSALIDHINKHNNNLHTRNHKPKGLVPIHWANAVCMFLPWLMARVEDRRARLARFFSSSGRAGSRTHRQHQLAFDEALKEYILASLMLDDGLRIKNYTDALVGRHIIPTVERDSKGRWVRITGAKTCFRGIADHPSVTLKVAKDELGAERVRTRSISPGIVRLDYLLEYWTGARARDLVRRGVIARVEDFNPDHDSYAFFVSPRIGGRRSAKIDKDSYKEGHACYSEDHLSNIFGRRFHQFIRDVMKEDVPGWDDPVRTREWRGIFTAHITRLLIGTYFGGILGDWGTACYLTDDSEHTLKRNYNRVGDRIAALRHEGIENPRYFDEVIKRILQQRPNVDWPTFWRQFDAQRPVESLDALETASTLRPVHRSQIRSNRAA